MSFFERAAVLVSEDGLFGGTTTLAMLVMVHAFQQQSNLRWSSENTRTSLTMRRDAERSFRVHFNISADQYSALEDLCDEGGGLDDVFAAYRDSLPVNIQGVRPDFVQRSVGYSGQRCSNAFCVDVAMRVSRIEATFYGVDECYPVKHFVKTCRGGCGATHHVNKKKESAPDGITWHTFYGWEDGIPAEISSKSGKVIMSADFLNHVALTLSRMRYVSTNCRLGRRTIFKQLQFRTPGSVIVDRARSRDNG